MALPPAMPGVAEESEATADDVAAPSGTAAKRISAIGSDCDGALDLRQRGACEPVCQATEVVADITVDATDASSPGHRSHHYRHGVVLLVAAVSGRLWPTQLWHAGSCKE